MGDLRLWLPIFVSVVTLLYTIYRNRSQASEDAMDKRLEPITGRITRVEEAHAVLHNTLVSIEREQATGFSNLRQSQALTDQSLQTHSKENNYRFQGQEQRVQAVEARIEKIMEKVHDDVQELAEALRTMAEQNSRNIQSMNQQHQQTLRKILDHLAEVRNGQKK